MLAPSDTPPPAGILDLADGICRWPLWAHDARTDGGGAYCGAAAEGSYCPLHAGMAYRPVDGRGPGAPTESTRIRSLRATAEGDLAGAFDLAPEAPPARVSFAKEAARFLAWRARKAEGKAATVTAPAPAIEARVPKTPARRPRGPVTALQDDGAAPFSDLAGSAAHYRAVRERLAIAQVAPVAAPVASPAPAPAVPAPDLPVPAPGPALSDIIRRPGNATALGALGLLLRGALPGGVLYLHGPSGCGKSLMAAVARARLGPERVLDRADEASAAMLDPILSLGGLMLGQCAPSDCQHAALISRAAFLAIEAPDAELRAAVLDRETHRAIAPGARAALLTASIGLPQLVGLARSLVLMAGEDGVISEEMAEDGLASLLPAAARPIKIEEAIRAVCQHYGVSRDDVVSQRRTKGIVRPRQVAMYLASTLTLRSLPEIGRRMGGRDHTTILHGVRVIRQRMADDAELMREIVEISAVLKGGEG